MTAVFTNPEITTTSIVTPPSQPSTTALTSSASEESVTSNPLQYQHTTGRRVSLY